MGLLGLGDLDYNTAVNGTATPQRKTLIMRRCIFSKRFHHQKSFTNVNILYQVTWLNHLMLMFRRLIVQMMLRK